MHNCFWCTFLIQMHVYSFKRVRIAFFWIPCVWKNDQKYTSDLINSRYFKNVCKNVIQNSFYRCKFRQKFLTKNFKTTKLSWNFGKKCACNFFDKTFNFQILLVFFGLIYEFFKYVFSVYVCFHHLTNFCGSEISWV